MTTNITGRNAYLKALQREWPEALKALQSDVFPKLAYLWDDAPKDPGLKFRFETVTQFMEATHSDDVGRALRHWSREFSICDEWMLDVARFTMFINGENSKNYQGDWRVWIDFPRTEQRTVEMKFTRRMWIPPEHGGFETWDQFAARLHSQLSEQLLAYRKQTYQYYGTPKENMERDAGWTVRYQRGQQAFEIAEGLIGYTDPEQTVYRAIERFAASIDLTLRKLPKRRTRK